MLYYKKARANLRNGRAMDFIRAERDNHLALICDERAAYFTGQTMASDDRHGHYSVIIDGAKQRKFRLPHFVQSSKDDKPHRIKVELMGLGAFAVRLEKVKHICDDGGI